MISVVIPIYNGELTLAAALNSVLAQTLPPDEVIVANDGSDDDSSAVARRFGPPVRLIELPHRGISATLNAAISETCGEFIAFLDCDDLWAPGKLALQMQALAEDPPLEAVFGHVVQFDDPMREIEDPGSVPLDGVPRVAGIFKSCLLVRRTALARVGPFDPLASADFIDWYSRAMALGIRARVLDELIAFRRVHSANMTRNQPSALRADYLRIAREAIARRRVPRRVE